MTLALHRYLHYSQHRQPNEPAIYCELVWDLLESPAPSARHVSQLDRPLPFRVLTQAATYPPVPSLRITCDVFPQPWPIEAQNPVHVTLLDVLQAIYSCLHLPLEDSEFERLSRKQQQRIQNAFERRCRLAINPSECASRGKLRVDCLALHTLFGGLSVSLENENSCILSLRRPPP